MQTFFIIKKFQNTKKVRTNHVKHVTILNTLKTKTPFYISDVTKVNLHAIGKHSISIQTAGLAFGGTGLCSYRVRAVDGSYAKHLTVESYTVIYAANSHTYYH